MALSPHSLFYLVLWYVVASDYGDGVISGTYELSLNGEKSSLELKPDRTFQQELNTFSKSSAPDWNWRRISAKPMIFSKEFLAISGQELGPHREAYGYIHKELEFWFPLPSRSITSCGTAKPTPPY